MTNFIKMEEEVKVECGENCECHNETPVAVEETPIETIEEIDTNSEVL